MRKSRNEYIAIYKKLLQQGDVQIAYMHLYKYLMSLKTYFAKELGDRYSFGNVSPGYMDYSYFPFFDEYLRSKQLRFGVVLNHRETHFELWLMGQNKRIQTDYWLLLKDSKWNKSRNAMPQYSVLEAVLVKEPDFDNLEALTENISKHTLSVVDEIHRYLQSINRHKDH